MSAVHWTDEALARLDELQAHIAAEDPATAARMIERPYRIIYRLEAERIEIVTIQHYRQRLPHRHESLEGHVDKD